jgi:hypothetical protein
LYELLGDILFDQPFVGQPLDGPDLRPGITQCVPGRDEPWMSLVELILEVPEGALALQRAT